MSELTEILNQLKGVKKGGDEWLALCPAHNDRIPSLSITEKEGKLLLHCHAGCSFEDIMAKLKVDKTQAKGVITNTYNYCDERNGLLYQVVRYEPKSFRQRRPSQKWTPMSRTYGEWIWDLKGITPVLYNLPAVLQGVKDDQLIYFVEGEKDADNLIKEGLIATTMSGGSNSKWQPQYTETLEDAMVVLIPDNDEAGKKWANNVGNMLYGWTKMLKVIELSCGLAYFHIKEGTDVTDWLQDNTTRELEKLVLTTKDFIPAGAVTREEHEALKRHIIRLHSEFILFKAFRKKKDVLL